MQDLDVNQDSKETLQSLVPAHAQASQGLSSRTQRGAVWGPKRMNVRSN